MSGAGRGRARPERSTPPLQLQLARRANELLADGEWHPLEKVITDLSRLVPPGVAVRRSERDRLAGLKQHGTAPQPRKKPRTPEQIVRSGARRRVVEMLSNKRLYEMKAGQVRMVGEHAAIKGDRLRGEILLPVLNELATVLLHHDDKWAWQQVQLSAHNAGLHLTSCPKRCQLGGPVPDAPSTEQAS